MYSQTPAPDGRTQSPVTGSGVGERLQPTSGCRQRDAFQFRGEIPRLRAAGSNAAEPPFAVIPVEMYERLIAEREARFQVLDRIRERLPEMPVEEAERDVAEAVAAVRAADAEGGA